MRKAVVLRALRRRAVACEVRAASPVRMRRVEGALATSPAEEHLRVGPHERDRDLSAPEHLALDDRPHCLTSSLCRVDLSLPEEAELLRDCRRPRTKNREGSREELGPRGLNSRRVLLGLGLITELAEVVPASPEDLVLVQRRPREQDREVNGRWSRPAREIFNRHVDLAPIHERVGLRLLVGADREAK